MSLSEKISCKTDATNVFSHSYKLLQPYWKQKAQTANQRLTFQVPFVWEENQTHPSSLILFLPGAAGRCSLPLYHSGESCRAFLLIGRPPIKPHPARTARRPRPHRKIIIQKKTIAAADDTSCVTKSALMEGENNIWKQELLLPYK